MVACAAVRWSDRQQIYRLNSPPHGDYPVHEMRQYPANNSATENKCATQQGIDPQMRNDVLRVQPNTYKTRPAKKSGLYPP
jgi:hypothetical protein